MHVGKQRTEMSEGGVVWWSRGLYTGGWDQVMGVES